MWKMCKTSILYLKNIKNYMWKLCVEKRKTQRKTEHNPQNRTQNRTTEQKFSRFFTRTPQAFP